MMNKIKILLTKPRISLVGSVLLLLICISCADQLSVNGSNDNDLYISELGTQTPAAPPPTQHPDRTEEVVVQSPSPTSTIEPLSESSFPAIRSVDVVYHRFGEGKIRAFGFIAESGEIIPIVLDDQDRKLFIQRDAWSPVEERFLLFEIAEECGIAPCPVKYNVYLVEADLSAIDLLFSYSYMQLFGYGDTTSNLLVWSPDGKQIAFGGSDPTSGYLAIYDLETGTIDQLRQSPENSYRQFFPVGWSQDAKQIVYISAAPVQEDPTGLNQLYGVDVVTREETLLYQPTAKLYGAVTSSAHPNLIAVLEDMSIDTPTGMAVDIKLVNLDHATTQTLLGPVERPIIAFSPDGETLAFAGTNLESKLCFLELGEQRTTCFSQQIWKETYMVYTLGWLPTSDAIAVYSHAPHTGDCGDVIVVDKDELTSSILIPSDQPGMNAQTCQIRTLSFNPRYPAD